MISRKCLSQKNQNFGDIQLLLCAAKKNAGLALIPINFCDKLKLIPLTEKCPYHKMPK